MIRSKGITEKEREKWNTEYGYGISPFIIAEYVEGELGRELKLKEAVELARMMYSILEDTWDDAINQFVEELKLKDGKEN